MTLEIRFTLSDRDVEHFGDMIRSAGKAAKTSDVQSLVGPVRDLIRKARESTPPEFVLVRLDKLELLADMATDEEWRLPDEHLQRVLTAIAYFADPEDMIPDRVPGLGFLDDAIVVQLVIEGLGNEIDAYEEFCRFRDAESARRAAKGLSTDVKREDWLADKRAVLHSRLRQRGRDSQPFWRLSSW